MEGMPPQEAVSMTTGVKDISYCGRFRILNNIRV
jgi:hypothetical protein